MTDAVKIIAITEGPVHIELVHQRLRDAWGIGRIGYKIRDNIDKAIRLSKDDVIRNGTSSTAPADQSIVSERQTASSSEKPTTSTTANFASRSH